MQILMSLTVEHKFFIKKMDVKSAYRQASGSNCDVYVRSLSKDGDTDRCLKLLVPACGLAESG